MPPTPKQPAKRRTRRPSPEAIAAEHGLVVDPETSARLGRIRQKNTRAEEQLQDLLRGLGLTFETNNRDLPGSPDVANRRDRWAVFAHGCYWHSHRGCPRATVPKRNREFWEAKFAANRARDARVLRSLRRQGYRAVVVWECQLRSSPERISQRLAHLLVGSRGRGAEESSKLVE
ncbi:very short patch repair endonuclease [Archangium sp.]|uniref:very short patch repair endonuclease n=1 Tax=Archangium sp. TaxID=1872627 RepID=UPI0039C88529